MLSQIRNKISTLQKLDGKRFLRKHPFKIFGSSSHQYKLNPCLSEDTIKSFEAKHHIKLPEDYRMFINNIGNGGCGPAYGLLKLSNWNLEFNHATNDFIYKEFPHIEKWNLSKNFDLENINTASEEYLSWENEYYDDKHIAGSIRICHYGCAIYYLLVVTGKESGNIWIDDRASDYGIYPAISKSTEGRLTFINWYDEWLTESIKEVSGV